MNNEEYLNKNTEGYKAFGSYDYYKKEILERMFLCQKWMAMYEKEFYSRDWWTDSKSVKGGSGVGQYTEAQFSIPDVSDKKVRVRHYTNGVPAMLSYISYLRRQIESLYPKISKLDKDEQKKYYDIFDDLLEDNREKSWMKYTRNYKAYRMYINLVEELGYSDMNMKQDAELGGDY